ncbi:MAG: hypothetical protein IJZ48_02860 [Oscillospiraceae bacterium]|nr:hypothetical protein [Oscillospiraceae bacterium]
MRQAILGTDRSVYKKTITKNILLCIGVFCVMAVLHLVCTAGRNKNNHNLMLFCNIATDILGGSFIIARLSFCVFPQRKLLKLYDTASLEETGTVTALDEAITHYVGVDCILVSTQDRRLFLPADTIELSVGKTYLFRLKGKLIVEVQEDES